MSCANMLQSLSLETQQRACLHGSSLPAQDRKSTRLNSSHANISYAVFCLKKKKTTKILIPSETINLATFPQYHEDIYSSPDRNRPYFGTHHLLTLRLSPSMYLVAHRLPSI